MTQEDFIYNGTVSDYLNSSGCNLLERLQPHTDWWNARYQHGLDPYSKSSDGPILSECKAKDRKGASFQGINFASQDYLSLSSHPKIKQAATSAIERYGVHSAGSSALMGNTSASIKLESHLADFLQMQDCTIFPTGWAAGYGVIKCLISSNDHIVIDQLSHACLIEGARNSTNNVSLYPHLSLTGLERRLKKIRNQSSTRGILVVTESLFSMDSDTPDIEAHQELSKKYNATLMVDAAHDMGCMGTTGRGFIEEQNMIGKVDLLMGSFSKTFASNGGYVATNHPAIKLALRYGSGPQTFSNALSPIQACIVSESIDIICSSEGVKLRKKMLDNAIFIRKSLTKSGFDLLGDPSAIIPVLLGSVKKSRLLAKYTLENGGLVNLVEYPAVSKNNSRFRLQVMSSHTHKQIESFVEILNTANKLAEKELSQ